MTAPPGRPRTILAICLATGFTTLIDQAILNVAVPSLRADLGASGSEVGWILAIYSLTFGLALVPAGRLGDAWGRGPLLVGGLAVFSAASAVGALATAPWVLVVSRLAQGLGAGTANPQVIGLIQDHFSGSARTRAFGAYAAVGSFSGLIAPLVGGLLLAAAGPDTGWRLVMAVNVPFGVVTCLVAARQLRFSRRAREGRTHLDLPGIGLLSAMTLCLLVAVVGDGNPAVWVALAVAALALLVWWERRVVRRGGVPVVLPALVRSRPFVLGTVVAMCWFGSSLGTGVVLTLALQEGLGLSPLAAGLCLMPAALAMGVASVLGWRVVRRSGRTSVTAALVVMAVVLAGMIAAVLTLPGDVLPFVLAGAEFLVGAATGLVAAPNQGLTLAVAPRGAHGLAAGFFQVSQRISSTICIAACTGAFVAATGPDGFRTGLVTGLGISLGLIVVAVAASAFDRGRPVPAAPVTTETP